MTTPNPTPQASKTPLSDAYASTIEQARKLEATSHTEWMVVIPADLGRQLERDLATATAENAALREGLHNASQVSPTERGELGMQVLRILNAYRSAKSELAEARQILRQRQEAIAHSNAQSTRLSERCNWLSAELAKVNTDRDEWQRKAFEAENICADKHADMEHGQRELAKVQAERDDWQKRHGVACDTISEMQHEREERESYKVLSELSSFLGQGIGDGSASAVDWDKRIRKGIADVMQVEVGRREDALAQVAVIAGHMDRYVASEVEAGHTLFEIKQALSGTTASAYAARVRAMETALSEIVSACGQPNPQDSTQWRVMPGMLSVFNQAMQSAAALAPAGAQPEAQW